MDCWENRTEYGVVVTCGELASDPGGGNNPNHSCYRRQSLTTERYELTGLQRLNLPTQ